MAASNTPQMKLVEFNTQTQLPIKLNSKNYPAWYKQLNSLLIAHDLEGYVTGTTPCPSAIIGTGDSAAPNPAFSLWVRQDKLLYIALLGSCGPEAMSVMSSADTSQDAWLALQRAFSNRSRSRIMSLKERLTSISKGTSSVSTYLQTIRSIADELTLIGNPVDDIDLVIHTLNGLGPSFKEFTASIRTRDTPILFNDLYDKLVDFEMFLQREENLATTPPMTANYVHGRQNNYGRGRNFTRSPSNSAAPKNKKATPSDEQVTCQFCEKDGHIAKNCYKIRGFPRKQRGPPRAHIAQATKPDNPELPNWLFDSGASHHVTNDLNNLSLKSDYTGADQLQVANGKSLPITHLGSTTISTSSTPLYPPR
ncbi:Copia polyprotein/retrotransposon [Trifolium repens]|nr:Copia polyprotein/retrotransposon [Trifolium repens]